MKNQVLHDLNFKELLEYPESFRPQHVYDAPIDCKKFCVECETSGTLAKAGGRLTLMSHACDSSDFETMLGPLPARSDMVTMAVMFLLEDPGGDYDFRSSFTHDGITKKVPNTHYYFSPSIENWPLSFDEVMDEGNYYGSYFAYLMRRHGLANVYITNHVKCKREGDMAKNLVAEKCMSHFLDREIEAFAPKLVFCFRKKLLPVMQNRFPNIPAVWLYHPYYIQRYCHAHGMSSAEAAAENDRCIEAALKDAGIKV